MQLQPRHFNSAVLPGTLGTGVTQKTPTPGAVLETQGQGARGGTASLRGSAHGERGRGQIIADRSAERRGPQFRQNKCDSGRGQL